MTLGARARARRLGRVLLLPDRRERVATLVEIRLNKWLPGGWGDSVSLSCTFAEFIELVRQRDSDLAALLDTDGPAEHALQQVREYFDRRAGTAGGLRLPTSFNADPTLAKICYALARRLRPEVIIETGVGYGITSAVMLRALHENGNGKLTSIDLPPINDAHGEQTGMAVDPDLARDRWSCHRGSSRGKLARLLRDQGRCDLFVSDSANVGTIQRFEWRTVRDRMSPNGAAVFNNVPRVVAEELRTSVNSTWLVRQIEKPMCVTAVVLTRIDW